MSQKVTIILDERDTHNSEIRGRFAAKKKIKEIYGPDMELELERKGPEPGETSYRFVRKQSNQTEETG